VGIVPANAIHLPVGRQFLVHLDSADVIHDFWVPQLARKMDMTPGHPDDISLQADRPGEYVGACVEYCGAEHAWMRILVIADPPAAFEAWQRRQRRPAPPPATADAIAGAGLFQQYVCQACHAAGVAVGPDLDHLASRRMLAAGVLPNTPANLVRWLRDPQALKPGSLMPDFHLTDADARKLVAYLETLQ
jgi:cytochrome c oxidase subunit 2